MRSNRAALLATSLAFGASAAVSGPAGAVSLSGTLAPVPGSGACLRDRGRIDPAALTCAQPVDALRAPSALGVSPDGQNVYVAAAESGSVVVLARRRGRGLAPPLHPTRRDCIQQSGGSDCVANSPGLAGADATVVSPDGRNVYVGSADAAAVVAFKRRPHGLLLPLRPARGKKLRGASCLHGREIVKGTAGRCTGKFAALHRVDALASSPDGRFLYVLSSGNNSGEDTLVTLRRAQDGSLMPMPGCIASRGGRRALCKRSATGLRGASALALSRDGRFAYVAASVSSAVSAFRRSPSSGALVALHGAGACVAQPSLSPPVDSPRCPASANGLGGARSLALSRDGRQVYVSGFDPGSLAVLSRDPLRGTLAAPSVAGTCLQAGPAPGPDCAAGPDSLRGASAVAVSRGDERIFLATQGGDAIFEITLTGGLPALPLSPFSHFGQLGGPQAIALSPDGRNVYVASPADDQVIALVA